MIGAPISVGDQLGHLGAALLVHGGEPLDGRDAFGRVEPRPGAIVEGGTGGRNRAVNIGGCGRGRLPDHLLGVR